MGVREQFSDLLSVLIVYAGIDSFFWRNNNDELKSALTYFNLNGEWSLVDPYYGIIFLNLQGELATISELKKSNWEIYSLEMESININNFKFVQGDYKVSISSKLISKFENTADQLTYWVALEKSSKFNV